MFEAQLGGVWFSVKDGDMRLRAMLNAHYSAYHYKDGRKPKLSLGPGEKLCLMTSDCLCAFAWRKFIDDSGQQGVNNAIFINNAPDKYLSSELIREACEIAWRRFPGERLYTYVDPAKVQSGNPGYCYEKAGWRKVRGENGKALYTGSGKLIFEILPDNCIEVIRIGEWRRYYTIIETVRGIK